MPPLTPTQITHLEQRFLAEISKWRATNHLSTLIMNTRLRQLAKRYSQDMGQRHFFSHVDPTGRNLSDRVLSAGIDYQEIGENLAKTVNQIPDPADVLSGWLLSSGHRRNLENRQFTETGLGIFGIGNEYYITQIFLKPPIKRR